MKTLIVFASFLLLIGCGDSGSREAAVRQSEVVPLTGQVAGDPSVDEPGKGEEDASEPVTPALAIASLRHAYPVPEWEGDAGSFMEAGPPAALIESIDTCVDELRFSGAVEAACFGLIQRACPGMEGTTTDIVKCGGAEFEYWDKRLNTTYNKLMSVLKTDDELMGDEGAVQEIRLTETVRTAQRSWLRFRDDSCAVERDRFRGGTLGRVTGVNCMVLETARRVVGLEVLLASFDR